MRAQSRTTFSLIWVVSISACEWAPPLADSPENLTIAIWTVGLRETPTSEITLSAEQAKQSVEWASAIWEANCDIRFVHAGHSEIIPAAMGLPYVSKTVDDTSTMQDIFFDAKFVVVAYVPQILYENNGMPEKAIGVSTLPGTAQSILVHKSLALPQKVTLAHELGHYFGLRHVHDDEWEKETSASDRNNIMHITSSEGINLHPVQCEKAKKYLLGWRDYQELCRPYAHEAVELDSNEEVDFTCGYRPDFDADFSS